MEGFFSAPNIVSENGSQRQIRRRLYIGQQPGTKSARGPADNTAGQPLVVFLHRFTWDFGCSCFRGDVQDSRLRWSGSQEGRLSSLRTDPSASRPAPPPRRAPARPDLPVVCPGFGPDS